MAAHKMLPQKFQDWVDARKKFHLSHAHIQMARELGMNPRTFGKLANPKQEPWKEPLPNFIETLYYKKHLMPRPVEVQTIEQLFKHHAQQKANRKKRKLEKREPLHALSLSSTTDRPSSFEGLNNNLEIA